MVCPFGSAAVRQCTGPRVVLGRAISRVIQRYLQPFTQLTCSSNRQCQTNALIATDAFHPNGASSVAEVARCQVSFDGGIRRDAIQRFTCDKHPASISCQTGRTLNFTIVVFINVNVSAVIRSNSATPLHSYGSAGRHHQKLAKGQPCKRGSDFKDISR